MTAEFTAIIEPALEGGFWAIVRRFLEPMAKAKQPRKQRIYLRETIELIFDDRKADILRGLPDDTIQKKVMVGLQPAAYDTPKFKEA